MNYCGDVRLGDTLDCKFTTRKFSTGAPFALAGSPAIAAYVGNSTTEITAGITLTVDFDGRTGCNHVRVVATSGNGFATASDVDLVVTAGTVDGVSVVGEVIGSFSIEKRSALMPTVAARTLDVTATGGAGIDWANVENPTTTLGLSGTTVKTATDVETDTADIQTRLPAALVSGRMDSSVGAIVNGVIVAATFAANALDAVWSTAARVLTAGTNIVLAKGVGVTGFNDLSAADVNAEVDTAIGDARLDELLAADSDIDGAAPPAVGSVFHELMTKTAGSFTYDQTTDSLEALRDRGDAAWVTGSAAPTAAAIADAVWDEAIAGHAGAGSTGEALTNAGAAAPTAAAVADAVWDEARAGHVGAGSFGESVVVDKTGYALSTAGNASVADKILGRHIAGGSDVSGSEARNVTNALRALRNRQAIVAGTGTVYEEDDNTAAWTYAATTTAGNPLSEINPT